MTENRSVGEMIAAGEIGPDSPTPRAETETLRNLVGRLMSQVEDLQAAVCTPEDAYLVVYGRGGIAGAYVGADGFELAKQFAEATHSVVVSLPILVDYRTGEASQ